MRRNPWLSISLLALFLPAGCGGGDSEPDGDAAGGSESTTESTGDDTQGEGSAGGETTAGGTGGVTSGGEGTTSGGDGDSDGDDRGMSSRDSRYCEILPFFTDDNGTFAEVWNTAAFSDCPQDEWDALDPEAIVEELGATSVNMNGPRAFLMDEVEGQPSGTPRFHTFGTLRMVLAATLDVGADELMPTPYAERAINRVTVFRFWAGSEVYELVAPDESTYVMQSYAMIADPDLTVADLPALGGRLQLPEGWTFRARVLDEDLEVVATEADGAVVVQDDLQNTYQRYR